MRVEVITHKSGEQIPIILDRDGLPIPTPNEFIFGRLSLSTNTLVRNLRELAIFYDWLESKTIDLWERIQTGVAFTEAEVKSGIVDSLRREQLSRRAVKKIAVAPNTFNQRLTTVRQFLSWCFDVHLSSLPLNDNRYERIRDQQIRIMKWLDTSFINAPPSNKDLRKGLNDQEVAFLIETLNPNFSDTKTHNKAVRYRNYIAVMIMLNYGLRAGELLCLRVEDVQIGAISSVRVIRRPPDINDKRKPRPKIKRNGRVLPIDNAKFVSELDDYIMYWREILLQNAKEDSEYLILSDDGRPLSQSSLTQFFQILRAKHNEQLPEHLSAKALRHTFSSKIERTLRSAGMDEERRKQALAYLRGDSSLNSQSVYIAQEIEEQAHAAMKQYQSLLLRD